MSGAPCTDDVCAASGRPRLAVHRFGGCGGCLLALLGVEGLAAITGLYDIAHWLEAGVSDPEAEVDVALVEGSVSTAEDRRRLEELRARAACLVAVGVCATAGGPQARRALAVDGQAWPAALYPQPALLGSLGLPVAIGACVRVDHAIWGCPVDSGQLLAALRHLAARIAPETEPRPVCAECKLAVASCVWVADGLPCLGPVTRAGCGGLCPRQGRACYGCFGLVEGAAAGAFIRALERLEVSRDEVARCFGFVANARTSGFEGAPRTGPELP
jgi:coenzyme F420-reducing hydrogenase gamma subunit